MIGTNYYTQTPYHSVAPNSLKKLERPLRGQKPIVSIPLEYLPVPVRPIIKQETLPEKNFAEMEIETTASVHDDCTNANVKKTDNVKQDDIKAFEEDEECLEETVHQTGMVQEQIRLLEQRCK